MNSPLDSAPTSISRASCWTAHILTYHSWRIVVAAVGLCCSNVCFASGLTALEDFLQNKTRGRLTFTQNVVAQFDGTPRGRSNRGSLEFIRPARIRIDYSSPDEVVVVINETSVTVFDGPLSLTTIYRQIEILPPSITLLLKARAVSELLATFDMIERLEGGIDWVVLTPRDAKGSYVKKISAGFDRGELTRVDVETVHNERLRHQLSWAQSEEIEEARFKFEPPAGSDVINRLENADRKDTIDPAATPAKN